MTALEPFLEQRANGALRHQHTAPLWALTFSVFGCAGSLHPGTTPDGYTNVDGVQVTQEVADYIVCVRNRGAVELTEQQSTHLLGAVQVLGQEAKTAYEVREKLRASYQPIGDPETERRIVDACLIVARNAAATREAARVSGQPQTGAAGTEVAPTWPWITGGIGLAALGVGVGFGIDGLAAKNQLERLCEGQISPCEGHGSDEIDPLNARKNRGLGFFIGLGTVGTVTIIASAAGLSSEQSPPQTATLSLRPSVTPGVWGMELAGDF